MVSDSMSIEEEEFACNSVSSFVYSVVDLYFVVCTVWMLDCLSFPFFVLFTFLQTRSLLDKRVALLSGECFLP